MADYGRITIKDGKNYFYDDKTKQFGQEVKLKMGDTGLDRNGKRNMWDGSKWVPTFEFSNKRNGSYIYNGQFWRDKEGLRLADDNVIKLGNGNYKRLNPDGTETYLMRNGQFTEQGNALDDHFKENMLQGNVYDVRISDVNGKKFSKARTIRQDQGRSDLANEIHIGWRNDTDFDTNQRSINNDSKEVLANRKEAIDAAESYKPQTTWLQKAKANTAKRDEEVIKSEQFKDFVKNEQAKDSREGTGYYVMNHPETEYTPYDWNTREQFGEATITAPNRYSQAVQKYIDTHSKEDLEKVQRGLATTEVSKSLQKGADKIPWVAGGIVAGTALAPYVFTNPIVTNLLTHPVENIIAPQVASYAINKGLDKTNLGETEKELISTSLGFALGQGVTQKAKDAISKTLLKKGYGYLYESEAPVIGKVLQNQLKSNYLNLADAGSKTTWAVANGSTYLVPSVTPAAGQYVSYKTTGKDIGSNIKDITGINGTVANFLAEGLLGSTGNLRFKNQAYTAASMSGGKKGWSENYKYFTNKSGHSFGENEFKHKPNKIIAATRFILGKPGENNYQMSTIASTGTGKHSTHYVASNNAEASPVKLVKNWVSGDDSDLGGELKTSGTIMLGNTDVSTGNEIEQLGKVLGSRMNDGRFATGQRARLLTPNDNGETGRILKESQFIKVNDKGETEWVNIFDENGKINPDIFESRMGSRNNVFSSYTKTDKGYKGVMLDVDGHIEIPIKNKDGKISFLHIDTQGPGSGARGGNSIVRAFSKITSRQQDPSFIVTVSGNRSFINSKPGEISQMSKLMHPVESNLTHKFGDTESQYLTITDQNVNSKLMKALYGDTEEYKAVLSKLEASKNTAENIRNRGRRIKETLDSKTIDPESALEKNKSDITSLGSYKTAKKDVTKLSQTIEDIEQKKSKKIQDILKLYTSKYRLHRAQGKLDRYNRVIETTDNIKKGIRPRTKKEKEEAYSSRLGSLYDYISGMRRSDIRSYNKVWKEAANNLMKTQPVDFFGIPVPINRQGNKLEQIKQLKQGGPINNNPKTWEEYQKQNRNGQRKNLEKH